MLVFEVSMQTFTHLPQIAAGCQQKPQYSTKDEYYDKRCFPHSYL